MIGLGLLRSAVVVPQGSLRCLARDHERTCRPDDERSADVRRLAPAIAAYGTLTRSESPKLIYSTSIDTDQSFGIRVLRGRRPIAEVDVTVDR